MDQKDAEEDQEKDEEKKDEEEEEKKIAGGRGKPPSVHLDVFVEVGKSLRCFREKIYVLCARGQYCNVIDQYVDGIHDGLRMKSPCSFRYRRGF